MKYKFEQSDIKNTSHLKAFGQISDLSAEFLSMKFYSVDDIKKHELGVLALENVTNDFLGYVALTEIAVVADKKLARIGALAVAEEYQGNGVAKGLIEQIVAKAQDARLDINSFYAYVNDVSLNPFSGNGFEIVALRSPLSNNGCNTVVSLAV